MVKRDAAEAVYRRAVEEWERVFGRFAGWLEATYRAADRDERADAVRPSRRRPGTLLEDDRRVRRAPAAVPEPAVTPRPVAVEERPPSKRDCVARDKVRTA